MDIAFAREVTESMIGQLRYHIEDHHTLFKKLFPAENLTPKHHFLVHYPFSRNEAEPSMEAQTLSEVRVFC